MRSSIARAMATNSTSRSTTSRRSWSRCAVPPLSHAFASPSSSSRFRMWKDAALRASLPECGHDLFGDQFELPHDVPVRHAGEEETADEMGETVLRDERREGLAHLVGTADEEAVLHEPIEIGGDGGVDEGMPPAARVLLAVGD